MILSKFTCSKPASFSSEGAISQPPYQKLELALGFIRIRHIAIARCHIRMPLTEGLELDRQWQLISDLQ